MCSRRTSVAVVGLLYFFVLSLYSGCTSPYVVRAEQYGEAIGQTNVVHLVLDATVFSDVEGGDHVVHVQKSEQMLSWIRKTMARIVTEKGYNVSDRSIGSVGLSARPGSTLRVFLGSEENGPGWMSADNLEQRQIPIVFQASDCDEHCVETISKLHWNLLELGAFKGHGRMNSSSTLRYSRLKASLKAAVEKLDLEPDSILMVTQSVTVEIPAGKKVAQFLGSAAFLFMGIPVQPMWDSDSTMQTLTIVNPAGDVLWTYTTGPWAGDHERIEDTEDFLESHFQYLPDHPGESPRSE
jgi:hypothetical protein